MVDYYIESLNNKNAIKWEEFNNNSNEGSFYHSLKWKQLLENTSGVSSHYFLLLKNNSVLGIFPFIENHIKIFKGFIPLPNSDYNHAIIQDYSDPSIIQYVIKKFQNVIGKQQKTSFIKLTTLHKETMDNIKNYPIYTYTIHGNMSLNLREYPPEKIWDNFSAKKGQRKFIRRFDEKGFWVKELNSHDDLNLFYKYYKNNIDFIGGSLESFSHFNDLWNNLSSDEMRITLLSKNATIAGGLLMFTYKPQRTVYFHYLSLNRDLPNTYHPTYYLFWEAINWAWDNKYEKISFGRQHLDENNPRYRIKNEFGSSFVPIYSKIISLSKFFTIGYNFKQYANRIHFFR